LPGAGPLPPTHSSERWPGRHSTGSSAHRESQPVALACENRYDRATTDVERITGKRPQSVEEFVAVRKDFYLG
jgi:hypothetical protein